MSEYIKPYLTNGSFFMEICDRTFRYVAAVNYGYAGEQLIEEDGTFVV